HRRYDCGPHCPVAATMDRLSGKWAGSILFLLAEAPARFNVLRRLLGDLPARSLTDQLLALEERGLVSRSVGAGRPPAVTYALTEEGARLLPVLEAMADYGVGWLVRSGIDMPDDRSTRTRRDALEAGE
ncbi:MAG: helix-turn-helix domain-containing protein, partial [Pseudomonadota bacterium]